MKGSNFPVPTGPYKICINRTAPWQRYKTCRLQISVGKPQYEGEKFRALCEWARNRFPRTVYIVSDTLQRHNILYETGCTPASAWKLSRAEGDRWLERNMDSMRLATDHSIFRWDELIGNRHYRPIQPMQALDQAIDKTVADFWRRHSAVRPQDPAFAKHSRDFLLEELAVFAFLFNDPAIDVYAGSWFKDLMEVQFPEKDYLSVDYTRNKAA